MTTNNLIPSETELEAAANALFGELDGSIHADTAESYAQNFSGVGVPAAQSGIFEPEVCAQGIERFVTEGDTSVINAAVHKLQAFENTYGEFDELSGLASEFEEFSGLGGGYQELEQYISGANDNKTAQQKPTGGYEPNVVSMQQAQESNSIEARTTATDNNVIPREDYNTAPKAGTVGGQRNNGQIIIGTKTLEQIREDFPILQEKVNGNPLIWLDNGATTQRPRQVIDRLSYYYEHENSNVHRGAHTLAARSTDAYENARQTVADFIGAQSKDEIIFVRGTTEGINLVAHSYVKPLLEPGDEIIVSLLEHHANIVPWQLVAQETGAVIKVIPVDESGKIKLSEYEKLFTKRTRFVSVTHVSNVLGTITPVAELIAIAHRHGVRIMIDGAQSIAHIPVNITALDADFYVFSGHKVYAPTGIGALYGKKEVLEEAKPYHGGGNMIADVTFERTIYNPAPNKFEAGTGSIGDAVALGAALDYLREIGMPEISRYEHELVSYGMKELGKIPGLHLIGTAREKSSALSFVLDGTTIDAVGQYLDQQGIAVRVGHHCAQPILRSYGLEGVVRPTLALYNTPEDVDALARAIRAIR
jgi:cysteine desulfurase/selenocysteine lyase